MPSSHSSNYCAYCGAWALEQQEGFCIPCWDDFKTKTKKEKEMNIADGVVAEAKEIKLTPASEAVLAEFTAKVKELLLRPDFCLVLLREGWVPASVASKVIESADNLRQYLVDHPVLNFDVPDEIWVPFIESIDRASHPESPPESSGQPEQPRA